MCGEAWVRAWAKCVSAVERRMYLKKHVPMFAARADRAESTGGQGQRGLTQRHRSGQNVFGQTKFNMSNEHGHTNPTLAT